ncbi:MAG: hypothetical protein FJW20_15540 [Acidimicrobiia bacterium]|nr:hypothetical protein [Acidimicrobiia bacterium]
MRLLVSLLLAVIPLCAGTGWTRILSSLGAMNGAVVVAPAEADPAEWKARIEGGAIVVVEGDTALGRALRIESKPEPPVTVRSVTDEFNPALEIVWEKAVETREYAIPEGARVYTREREKRAPLVAGLRRGKGALLWLAVSPGEKGYERFPYLPQALRDLGFEPPAVSRRLWAFFDASYRSRVDLEYFAARWRKAGIAALQVAAWHFWEPDAERDEYLRKLIRACHRNGILVYAWLELPHVSEQFWTQHPEWREKTALGQDAHLDWRKLMNLQNPDCAREVEKGVARLMNAHDWDGVNLAELYFESLEGHANAARFTPMNVDVRREFGALHGFDPLSLFQTAAPDGVRLRSFLDWRAELARRMQADWIGRLERVRKENAHLDLVLTHVDDRYDRRMRDLIGADAARLLPLMDRHDFTFLVEDPATIWHLGPERYPEIALRYAPLVKRREKLAIDINIVERYQDVYPTKQQTGAELFQLVHLAARAFSRVALYFENSILAPDLDLLPAAAAVVERMETRNGKLKVETRRPVGIRWKGAARVNGHAWPAWDGEVVWLPAGEHVVEEMANGPPMRVVDLNGELESAAYERDRLEVAYRSESRALLVVNERPGWVEVDGVAVEVKAEKVAGGWLLRLPRGQHVAELHR